MSQLLSLKSAFQLAALASSILVFVKGQGFAMTGGECHEGHSGPNCPRVWYVTGGPGWVGQRPSYPVQMICSPSCTDATSAKECSLIVAMHGIFSNPNDQKWLMMGTATDPNYDTFLEDNDHGGPFCISFHKSKGDAWEYKCGGDDEAHLEGFVEFAFGHFPIDPNAVNLHGFSSGGIQVHHMMSTGCSIESLISAASSYGSGNVVAPPTTKAAYLLAHGTHDDIVAYDNVWDATTGTAVPSCECTLFPGQSCFNQSYLQLQGERLAGAIAALRGYIGDIWGSSPAPSYRMNLINDDTANCNAIINKCFSPIESPNPFNTGFSCDSVDASETEVIEYPIPNNSDSGPVTVWRINLHNHDYPNKRRSSGYGPTEFFFQLKKFFNNNRGRQTYPGSRSISQIGTGYLCSNPPWDQTSPEWINRIVNWDGLSADQCKDRCLQEARCVEAFYLDATPYGGTRGCAIYYDLLPCSSTVGASWANAVHWKASTSFEPSQPPSTPPPMDPLTPIPTVATPSPVASPTAQPLSMCSPPENIIPGAIAGYTCLVNGVSNGQDSNDGTSTATTCANAGGDWSSYDCSTAEDYLSSVDQGTAEWLKTNWWGPKCCEEPNASPTSQPVTLGPTVTPGCPAECSVPTCVWSGTDGPGWDLSWTGDEDGTQTKNGFCTNYCKAYDVGKYLCGSSAWHQTGIDCSACAILAMDPIIPPEDREPSVGLCATVAALSGHALWGDAIKQCTGGPQPSDNTKCTVYQAFNGDEIVNPERTCGSFCSHFGFSCINGYDDGEDGCLYGGPGIGCNDILGVGSVGGPTPDHVCVCGSVQEPTAVPTKSPTMSPTKAPTNSPTASPSKSPTANPTKSPTKTPTNNPTVAPTKAPTGNPSMSPTAAPSKVPPTPSPILAPTLLPTIDTTVSPTTAKTYLPTSLLTKAPTSSPTVSPTRVPTDKPTTSPTHQPTNPPTSVPTALPTRTPTAKPTASPTKLPTKAPSQNPTTQPTASFDGFCEPSSTLLWDNYAGHSCLDGLGDSNLGMTETSCSKAGGQWSSYTCTDAKNFWVSVGGENWEGASLFQGIWTARCCSEENVESFCPASNNLLSGFRGGHSCVESLGDSLLGMTQSDCIAAGGTWAAYTCTDADNFWMQVGGVNWEHGTLFQPLYASKCCTDKPDFGTLAIGSASESGFAELIGDEGLLMQTTSGDIWGTSDSFQFSYRRLQADGVVYARVHKPTVTHAWVKSGLMIRENLDSSSKNVALLYTGNHGMICHGRYAPGSSTTYFNADWINRGDPIWLAIVRTGNKFDFYKSEDASTWSPLASSNVAMDTDVYVGLALTSLVGTAPSTGYYENFGVDDYANSRKLGFKGIDSNFDPVTVTKSTSKED
mmetsp:Transcript_18961/g.28092  ORF Transcript_18961/g.28092 Transcript_18961/m.28092 type:complete len:1368 (+) Transcript_18961:371-4474(+)|eukprot:CAMPEP_0194209878 /NCGR_PEP_ID=MMETSP0156-20130528/7854_1 /TAXON_ID=33649 /ORGANISM="Thalassionema nitzschioides, Strain L26-B" /LENGTH=1367 /DNA_ID=CAMNT_0038937131 /DNA_START=342 /DNA_END=4445 /DNA_ORIENTATION=-